jgi:hypothetical protein
LVVVTPIPVSTPVAKDLDYSVAKVLGVNKKIEKKPTSPNRNIFLIKFVIIFYLTMGPAKQGPIFINYEGIDVSDRTLKLVE